MFRILSLNIHKGFSWLNKRFVLPQLREAIQSTSADIVFLQEVIGKNITKAQKYSNWPSEPHYKFLADLALPRPPQQLREKNRWRKTK